MVAQLEITAARWEGHRASPHWSQAWLSGPVPPWHVSDCAFDGEELELLQPASAARTATAHQ